MEAYLYVVEPGNLFCLLLLLLLLCLNSTDDFRVEIRSSDWCSKHFNIIINICRAVDCKIGHSSDSGG